MTTDDLVGALRDTGLQSGDHVFVQCSLRNFGRMAAPCETVMAALRTVLGAGGTLAVPTFNFGFLRGEHFDVDETSSESGLFSEFVRRSPEARRSQSPPFHSVAAIGAHADVLSRTVAYSSFARASVFGTMYDLDFQACLLGSTFVHNAFFYYVEEQARVPYRFHKWFSSTVGQRDRVRRRSFAFYARFSDPVIRNNFHQMGESLLTEFGGRRVFLGRGPITLVSVRKLVDTSAEYLNNTPDFLVMDEDKNKLQDIKNGYCRP